MSKLADKVVKQAKEWLGFKESDGTHRTIIDVYNSHKPLARGYKVTYTDAWCATFVSAVAIKLGYTDIIPTECSCNKMIELLKKLGSWVENEERTPCSGDLIFYDWDDSGKGDNKGNSDHVGIVEKVSGNTITVIEGNYSNSVKRRTLAVNGKYIRGYGVPKYDTKPSTSATSTNTKEKNTVNITLTTLQKGSKGTQVKTVQRILKALGYDLGSCGVDGDFGTMTDKAVKAFQKNKQLTVDGIVGKNTWEKMLKG